MLYSITIQLSNATAQHTTQRNTTGIHVTDSTAYDISPLTSVEDENIAQTCHSARVLSGEMKEALLDVGKPPYDLEKGYTRHSITEDAEGIIIELQRPSIINTIKLLLWDLDNRSYSYKIEYSIDHEDWTCVIDYSKFSCRSSQMIYFDPVVAK